MNPISRVAIIGECMVELKNMTACYSKVLAVIRSIPRCIFLV